MGATSVDPAPLRVAADAAAVLRPKTQPANSAAQVNLAISFERNAVFLSSVGIPDSARRGPAAPRERR